MTELEYGINVANKFDLLFGDDDPTEALSKASAPADKKKKTDVKAPAGNVLKEKPGDKKPEAAKKPGQPDAAKGRNVPVGGPQQQGQRPPRSAPQGARPEQGKENTTGPRPSKPEGQQRSPAAAGGQQGGPRRFGGPRPEGSAPARRPAPMDQDYGAPTTGDQEVPEQRIGFGGRGGFRGGASFRGRSQYPREQREGGEAGAAQHARGREYERHSGSNKTGVKPMTKRDGAGPHNWGTFRDEAELGTDAAHKAPVAEGAPATTEEGAAPVEGAVEGQESTEPTEPQVHEKTLKEWLEEEERNRLRPKYATRQANEGESEQKVFQKMRRVTREKANADGLVEVVEYVEVDVDEDNHVPSGSKQKAGGPFQLVFAPAAHVEGERGPSGRGGRGGPRGGPRGGRGGAPYQGGRGGQRGGPGGRQAPPPADELNFPALG